jgi:Terminase RNaseH-like domain
MDFGWDHPFAAVELAWDRDSDVVYVARTHRLKEGSPIVHAAALRAWGKELRWAWPRDVNRETLEGAGVALAAEYRPSRQGAVEYAKLSKKLFAWNNGWRFY